MENMVAGSIFIIINLFMMIGFMEMFRKIENQKHIKTTSKTHIGGRKQERPRYYALINYQVNGKEYQLKSKFHSTYFANEQRITVSYNQEQPEDAKIKLDLRLMMPVLLFLTIGLLAFLSGFYHYFIL